MSPEQILTDIAIADHIGDADEVSRLRALLAASAIVASAPAPIIEAPTAPILA